MSSEDRVVLLSLRNYERGLTQTEISLVTGLKPDEVDKSIAELERLRVAGHVYDDDNTFFVSIPLRDRPLVPFWEEWLKTFLSAFPQPPQGNPLDPHSSCGGVVLLSAIVSGSRDAKTIAVEAKYPLDFVKFVIRIAERQKVFSLDSAFELQQALKDSSQDLIEVRQCLDRLEDDLWLFCGTDGILAASDELLAGRPLGGNVDQWIDAELPKKRHGLALS
jgi:hypothetical protein